MNIQSISAASSAGAESANSITRGNGFARALNDMLTSASEQDNTATKAVEQLATGKTDNLHSVSLASARADLSLRLVVEVRNRLQEAYQDIMRMQV